MAVFHVELKKVIDDSYPIEIGSGLTGQVVLDIRGGLFGNRKKLAVITDDVVAGLYGERICGQLKDAGIQAKLFAFPNGEKSKTRETKAKIEDEMLAAGFRRDCAVLAVGGGVVTDLAGFLAGTFARGVPFANYATTLLAAADASIGGKTAVDTPLATNLIGLFNQPVKVYLDLETWKTLPMRQICSGLAETIKHACMADADFFIWLEQHLDDVLGLDPEACMHIAQANCRIKYQVVMQDEQEAGLREILNLGHTVGRAIETVSGYRLEHGEAVAIGMAAQAHLSLKKGYMTADQVRRTEQLLERAHLPIRIPEYIDRDALLEKLYTDKKVRYGKLRFVLQKGIGGVVCFGGNGTKAQMDYATPVSREEAAEILAEL